MLNNITIMGRICRDIELRRTASGTAVASFAIACDRDFPNKTSGEKETDFVDVVCWKHTAEFVSKYFNKGSLIVVSGRLQIRSWNDNDGNKRRTAEVVADNVYFGGSKNSGEYTYAAPATYSSAGMSDYAMLEDDDAQLPF